MTEDKIRGWQLLSMFVALSLIDGHQRFLMKCLYMDDSRRYIRGHQSDTATQGDIGK